VYIKTGALAINYDGQHRKWDILELFRMKYKRKVWTWEYEVLMFVCFIQSLLSRTCIGMGCMLIQINLFNCFLYFILIYLRFVAKKVILTYINRSRPAHSRWSPSHFLNELFKWNNCYDWYNLANVVLYMWGVCCYGNSCHNIVNGSLALLYCNIKIFQVITFLLCSRTTYSAISGILEQLLEFQHILSYKSISNNKCANLRLHEA